MVTTRESPTPANTPGGVTGQGEYADAVAAQTRALWATVPMMLLNVAGTENDITASVEPALDTEYAAPMSFWFMPLNDNTDAMTININSQGVVSLLDAEGEELTEGDVVAGRLYLLTVVEATQIRLSDVLSGTGGGDGGGGGTDLQVFASSGTWTKPATGSVARIQCWGGGGSGGRAGTGHGGGGGGGGGYTERFMPLSLLPDTVAVTVGLGGAAQTANDTNGNAGGNTTFGAFLTAYGGGAGSGVTANCGGGGGGGALGAGADGASAVGGNGGIPRGNLASTATGTAAAGFYGAGGQTTIAGANSTDGGGGGGGSGGNGGNAHWGGGGGGGGVPSGTAGVGGSSMWGGAGGGGGNGSGTGGAAGSSINGGAGGIGSTDVTVAGSGVQPGGGGGGSEVANSGAGGDGQCTVTVW